MSCEDQALSPTRVCTRWECKNKTGNNYPRLIKEGKFWVCPVCRSSYGENPFPGAKVRETKADLQLAVDNLKRVNYIQRNELDTAKAEKRELERKVSNLMQRVESLEGGIRGIERAVERYRLELGAWQQVASDLAGENSQLRFASEKAVRELAYLRNRETEAKVPAPVPMPMMERADTFMDITRERVSR